MKKLLLIATLLTANAYAQQPTLATTNDMVSGLVKNADQRKAEIDQVVKLVDSVIEMKMAEFKKLNAELAEWKRQYDNHEKVLNSAMYDILISLNAVQDRTKTMFPELNDKFSQLLSIKN